MAETIILFGGGDGGGYIFLNGRIIRIPPYDPATIAGRAQAALNAANTLVQAANVNKELSHEMIAAAQKLTVEAVGQLTKGLGAETHAKSA